MILAITHAFTLAERPPCLGMMRPLCLLRGFGATKGGSRMRGVNVVYYVTLLAVAAGLTAVLGYEIGWLATRSTVSVLMAGALVPLAALVAWHVSDD